MAYSSRVLAALTLSLAAGGCSSPQVTPDYYSMPVKTDPDGNVVPAPEKLLPVRPPATLEEAVIVVENLQRQYAWKATATDDTAVGVSNLLIGLVSFGLYKGVTHPSTSITAGTGALGAGAYAYGTGNKLGVRGNAYADAYERLTCSLIAASAHAVRQPYDGPANVAATTLESLLRDAEKKQATLAADAAEVVPYSVPVLLENARPASNSCPGPWTGKKFSAAYAKSCAVPRREARIKAPPPPVVAALDNAEKLEARLLQAIFKLRGYDRDARRMGVHLWQNAKFIDSQLGRAIRGTIADPLDSVDRVKTYMARKDTAAPADPVVDAHRGTPVPEPQASAPAWDDVAKKRLQQLEESNRAARQMAVELEGVVTANANLPALSFSQIDACRSAADQVAQGIIAASAPAGGTPAATPAAPATITKFSDVGSDIYTGLDFTTKPDEAQWLERLKICQAHLKVPASSDLTSDVGAQIKAGQCKRLAWK